MELVARDRWTREQLLRYRGERLEGLLRHAVECSPYYREIHGPAVGAGAALEELPTLSKRTLMAEFDRIVTDPRLTRDRVEAHLAGEQAGTPILGEYLAFSTSGTTGERGVFVYTREEFAVWVAACLRIMARAGMTPETRLVAIGAPSPLHITRQLFAAFGAGRAAAPRLSVTTPLDVMVRSLNEYRPEAIITYASIAALLADEQLEGRLEVEPNVVAVGSEVLTEDIERRIVAAWGIEPVNVYASTEVLLVASSSPNDRGLCLSDDLAVVEVVDENGCAVPPGVPGHKVLLTNLVNRAFPLIRYELSDSVVVAAEQSSALPYQLIESVGGRTADILSLPRRGGGRVAVHPYRLHAPLGLFADVRQYQIVRGEHELVIQVVLRPTASAADVVESVHRAVVDSLEDAGALPPHIAVEPVSEIVREPGHAAKLKLMTHRWRPD